MGPGCGFGYILAEAGYDIWMGNARGNYYSRKHTSLRPDAIFNTDYWNFSWDEIGNIDVPAMIDYALTHTGQRRLHYMATPKAPHLSSSASLRPDFKDKIISMHTLAPAAFFENTENLFLRAISQFVNPLDSLGRLIGLGEFLPNNLIMTLCMDEVVFQPICSSIIYVSVDGTGISIMQGCFLSRWAHTPAGAGVRPFVHYGQSVKDKGFRLFDYGHLRNRIVYGSYSSPYNLARITTPVFLHYSPSDPMTNTRDVDRLFRELGTPEGKFRIPNPRFGHLDFIWGVDAKALIYDRVINLLQAMDVHGFDGQDIQDF